MGRTGGIMKQCTSVFKWTTARMMITPVQHITNNNAQQAGWMNYVQNKQYGVGWTNTQQQARGEAQNDTYVQKITGTQDAWLSISPVMRQCRTYSQDTHDDFKPTYKMDNNVESARKVIEEDVAKHRVFVFMKGIPEMPQCGFSNMVCRILDAYEVEYGSRNVLEDPELRQGVKDYTQWPTIPQVFINGEFIGGSDILMSMHQNGELQEALDKDP